MEFSMTGQQKGDLFNTGDCLIEVTAWAGLTVYINEGRHVLTGTFDCP